MAKKFTLLSSALSILALVACSNEIGDGVASANDSAEETAEASPKTATIELTGNVQYDIVTFNAQFEDSEIPYSVDLSVDEGMSLQKSMTDVILEKLPDQYKNGLYDKVAEKILSKGEEWLDNTLDGFTMGVYSQAKELLLGWIFPDEEKEEFSVENAFKEVSAQIQNIEDILAEMRYQLPNELKTKAYEEMLLRRKELYNNLETAMQVLENKIKSINSSSKDYPTDSDKYKAVVKAYKDWGESTVGGSPASQQAVNLIKLITQTVVLPGDNVMVSDFLHLYDEYVYGTLNWEQDGITWRQLMRAEDAMILMKHIVASIIYYTVVDKNPEQVKSIKRWFLAYKKAVAALPIDANAKPKYIKYGSKWKGTLFTGVIDTIDYVKVLNESWRLPKMKNAKTCVAGSLKGMPQKAKENLEDICRKAMLNKNYTYTDFYQLKEARRFNRSRLYAGMMPGFRSKGFDAVDQTAANFAMPEAWYKELFNSYYTETSTGPKHMTLMQIFKSAGFKGVTTEPFKKNNLEHYFVTSEKKEAVVVMNSKEKYERFSYKVGIASVIGNTDGNIEVSDHYVNALHFKSCYAMDSTSRYQRAVRPDYDLDAVRYCKLKNNDFLYRKFFVPERYFPK